MGTYNKCMDIMPQQEGRLPIYLNRDVYSDDMYVLIHCMCWYSTCSKHDKNKPFSKIYCEQSEPKNLFEKEFNAS